MSKGGQESSLGTHGGTVPEALPTETSDPFLSYWPNVNRLL